MPCNLIALMNTQSSHNNINTVNTTSVTLPELLCLIRAMSTNKPDKQLRSPDADDVKSKPGNKKEDDDTVETKAKSKKHSEQDSRSIRGLPKEDDVQTMYSEILGTEPFNNKDAKKKNDRKCDYCGSPMPDPTKVEFYLCPCGHESIC